MISATVRLIGTDTNDATQTEDLAISGNGTVYPTKYFKTLTQSQVTVFTKSDSGSFAYEVKQGQWGVVWKQSTMQFRFDCKIDGGDGSTLTCFIDKDVQLTFSDHILSAQGVLLDVKANATFVFGKLVDAAKKTTSQGCVIRNLESSYRTFIQCETNGLIYIYGSVLEANLVWPDSYLRLADNCRVYNSILVDFTLGSTTGVATVDLFNVQCVSVADSPIGGLQGTFNKIIITDVVTGYNYGAYQTVYRQTQDVTIQNLYARNLDGIVRMYYPRNTYVAILDGDTDTWAIIWQFEAGSTGTVRRQYTFDLKVADKGDNPISGATVTLTDKNGSQVFNVTTDANGNITTQTVTRGYYDQAHGNALQDYGPHTLTVEKAGYQAYVKKFVLSAKVTWEIKVARANSILFNSGRPVLNIKPSDPENKNVVVF